MSCEDRDFEQCLDCGEYYFPESDDHEVSLCPECSEAYE